MPGSWASRCHARSAPEDRLAAHPALWEGSTFAATGMQAPRRVPLALRGPLRASCRHEATDPVLKGGLAAGFEAGIIGEVRPHIAPMRAAPGRVRPRHRRRDALLVADEDLAAAEIAFVGQDMQVVVPEGSLRGTRHGGELITIMALIGDLMRHDQMGLGIDNALHVIADMAAVLRPCRHGTGIRIRRRYLPVRCRCQLPAQPHHAVHFQPGAVITAGQMGYLFRACLAGFLPIRPLGLLDIAADLLLQMRQAAGDLRLGEVAIAIVDGLELAAVDGNAVAPQHADPTAELHELGTGPANGRAVPAPEIGDGLVVGHQPPRSDGTGASLDLGGAQGCGGLQD